MSYEIRLWSAETLELQKELLGHPKGIDSLAFTPDGKTLASGGGDRTLTLWDVATGEELRRFEGFSGRVSRLQLSPDGRALAAVDFRRSGVNPEVVLWRTTENVPRAPGPRDGAN
jgi:WD40 repeat protein